MKLRASPRRAASIALIASAWPSPRQKSGQGQPEAALKSLTSITRRPPSLMKVSLPSRSSTLMQSVELASTPDRNASRSTACRSLSTSSALRRRARRSEPRSSAVRRTRPVITSRNRPAAIHCWRGTQLGCASVPSEATPVAVDRTAANSPGALPMTRAMAIVAGMNSSHGSVSGTNSTRPPPTARMMSVASR